MQKAVTPPIPGRRFSSYSALALAVSIALVMLSASRSRAQEMHQKKISVNFQDVPLRQALNEVQELSGMSLVYNRAIFDLSKKISIQLKDASVARVLTALVGNSFDFQQIEKNIIISVKPDIEKKNNGFIRGRAVDEQTGEPLVGVNIWISELQRGVSADANGNYVINNIPPGTYTIVASFIGYNTRTYTGIAISGDKPTELSIVLPPSSTELTEVVVKGALDVKSAEVRHTDEVSLLNEIQTSDLIITGISNVQISRSLDFNAAEVVQRAPGVSVIDNFINVRGLYERYNMVYINSMIAPSSETDRRAFSFDLLPSGVIDKIIIHRNPAPELPGDFVGGLIKIHTKEAVPARQLQIRLSTQYRPGSSFQNDTYSYQGSSTDWLGFDNGTRALSPAIPARGELPNIPNAGQAPPQVVAENVGYGRKLDKNWSLLPNQSTGPDYRGQLNYYDSWKIGETRLSNLTSVFYTREFQTISQDYQIGPSIDMDVKYRDSIFHRTARLGAMQNFVLKINDHHKLYFDNFFNQLGRDETLLRGGKEPESFSPTDSVLQVQYFWQERSLYSGQVRGDHAFPSRHGMHNVQWGGGYSSTRENVPNQRRYELRYRQNALPGTNGLVATEEAGGEGFEFNLQNYRKTEENATSYYINTEWALPHHIRLKAGGFTEFKNRAFDNRYITIRPAPNFSQQDASLRLVGPNRQYVLSELLAGNFRLDGTGFIIRDEVIEGSSYGADNAYYAGYVAINIPLFEERLKIYGGIRYEWNRQTLTNERSENIAIRDVDQLTRYWLPSLNISWKVTETMSIRTAYGKSLNRPQFRELSGFTNFDLDDGYTQGNPDLVTAEVQNIDVRWEYYPAEGEWLSAGLFYKDFKNPIEYISATQTNSLRNRAVIRNTQGAEAYGAELEARKSLAFLGGKFAKGLSLILNAAYLWNRANLGADDLDYGADLRDSNRPLQGTSPFLVNAIVYYDLEKTGTSISTQYNVFGQRLYLAASTLYSDIFELPRHSLDLNVKQKLFRDVELQVGVKNLFNQPFRYYRDFYRDGKYDPSKVAEGTLGENGENFKPGSDYYYRNYKEGRYYSVSLSFTVR